MRCGVVFNCTNPRPWHKPWDQVYADVLERAVAAEELGYDHVWVTEHHFMEHGYCPSLLTVASAIAARTSTIKIGTWVLLLPMHNALRIAEDAAVVDNISKGRLILGVGLGYRIEELEAFGIPREERVSRLEEGIEVMRLAWGEAPFSFSGRHYDVKDLTVTPKPTQPGGPQVWMAVRGRLPALRAARLDCSVMLAVGGDETHYRAWADELRAMGKDPSSYAVSSHGAAYVTDDVEETREELLPYCTWDVGGGTDLFRHYKKAADHPRDAAFFTRRTGSEGTQEAPLPAMGDAEHCAARLRRSLPAPVTDLHVSFVEGMPVNRQLHFMERFAKEVMPRLKEASIAPEVSDSRGP